MKDLAQPANSSTNVIENGYGHRAGAYRQHLRLRLSWQWIRARRPDVANAIEVEAEKAFPFSGRLRTIAPPSLPASLEVLK